MVSDQTIDPTITDENGGGDISHQTTTICYKPTKHEVQSCQFSSWYPSFRNMDITTISNNYTTRKIRKNVTIESIIIRPLPTEFIEYLLSDGVCLPVCATKVSSCMNDDDNGDGRDDRWDSSDDDEDNDNSSNEAPQKYSFPDLTSQIQAAITQLGGAGGCMPKLNWSSPKDATWMNCGSLKCTKVGDVYLLLKSSDFIAFDLEKAWDGCLIEEETENDGALKVENGVSNLRIDAVQSSSAADDNSNANNPSNSNTDNRNTPHGFGYELVLRKWCNLHPSMEFRCFVYEHELVAISQRQTSKFYPHLQPPSDGSIHPSTTIINAFFQTFVQHRYSQGNIHKYVMDVYLDSQERVWIVDFNVWGDRTDGLLFDWKDLMELVSSDRTATDNTQTVNKDDDVQDSTPMAEMRVVTKDMKSMTYDSLSSYRGPTDVMDLLDSDGNYASSFEDFMSQCVRPSEM